MDKKTHLEYLALCKKLYKDEEFKRFIMLHTLRSSILKVEPYNKILNDMSE